MSPDDELDAAEEAALAATFATARALVSLLHLVQSFVGRRAAEDVRFRALEHHVIHGLSPRTGTPTSIHEALARLGGEK